MIYARIETRRVLKMALSAAVISIASGIAGIEAYSKNAPASHATMPMPDGVPIKDAKGCIIQFDKSADMHRTFKWTGKCSHGFAAGAGTQNYYLQNGTLAMKVTGVKNARAIFVGKYRQEGFGADNAKQVTLGSWDVDGKDDGEKDTTFEDDFRNATYVAHFNHGQLVAPFPVASVVLKPAGVEKFSMTSTKVVYTTAEVEKDGSFSGSGTIEFRTVMSGVPFLKTWVGSLNGYDVAGPGVYTMSDFPQQYSPLTGIKISVQDFNANKGISNGTMYGPDGSVWTTWADGKPSVDQDAINNFTGAGQQSSSDDNDDTPAIMSMLGMVLGNYAARSQSRHPFSTGPSVAASVANSLKMAAVDQTSSEKQQIEDAQELARSNVSKDTAERCAIVCNSVENAQTQRCVINFGGPGQSVGPCFDDVRSSGKMCRDTCYSPWKTKSGQ
jgi:hypothetical protein